MCSWAGSSSSVNRNLPCDVCQKCTSAPPKLVLVEEPAPAYGIWPADPLGRLSTKVVVITLHVARPTSGSVSVTAWATAVSSCKNVNNSLIYQCYFYHIRRLRSRFYSGKVTKLSTSSVGKTATNSIGKTSSSSNVAIITVGKLSNVSFFTGVSPDFASDALETVKDFWGFRF